MAIVADNPAISPTCCRHLPEIFPRLYQTKTKKTTNKKKSKTKKTKNKKKKPAYNQI